MGLDKSFHDSIMIAVDPEMLRTEATKGCIQNKESSLVLDATRHMKNKFERLHLIAQREIVVVIILMYIINARAPSMLYDPRCNHLCMLFATHGFQVLDQVFLQ